jgi:hypothetical protein
MRKHLFLATLEGNGYEDILIVACVNILERYSNRMASYVKVCIRIRGHAELIGHLVHTQYNVGNTKSV